MGERIDGGMHVSVIDASFTIDTSKPCKEERGTIVDCGQRREGSMFPLCAIGDLGDNRCPQVIVKLFTRSPSEILQRIKSGTLDT